MTKRITVCIDCSEENSASMIKLVKQFQEQLVEAIDTGMQLEPDESFNFDWCMDEVKS